MDSRKIVYKETSTILIGQLICVPLMVLVFYLLGYYDSSVLLGRARVQFRAFSPFWLQPHLTASRSHGPVMLYSCTRF